MPEISTDRVTPCHMVAMGVCPAHRAPAPMRQDRVWHGARSLRHAQHATRHPPQTTTPSQPSPATHSHIVAGAACALLGPECSRTRARFPGWAVRRSQRQQFLLDTMLRNTAIRKLQQLVQGDPQMLRNAARLVSGQLAGPSAASLLGTAGRLGQGQRLGRAAARFFGSLTRAPGTTINISGGRLPRELRRELSKVRAGVVGRRGRDPA